MIKCRPLFDIMCRTGVAPVSDFNLRPQANRFGAIMQTGKTPVRHLAGTTSFEHAGLSRRNVMKADHLRSRTSCLVWDTGLGDIR